MKKTPQNPNEETSSCNPVSEIVDTPNEVNKYIQESRQLAEAVLKNPDYFSPKQAHPESPYLPDFPHVSHLNSDVYPIRN